MQNNNNHRVLHREDDLLPFATSGFLNQPGGSGKSNATATLKRHLAGVGTSSASATSNAAAAAMSSIATPSSNIYDHLGETTGSKQTTTLITNRKVATLTSSNMMSYGSKPPKVVTSADDSEVDQRTMMKRLKRIQNGGSANANSNHGSQKLQIDSASTVEVKLSHMAAGKDSAAASAASMAAIALTHPGIISTSSWRVGETLVQKQIKEQQQQQRQMIAHTNNSHSPIRQTAIHTTTSSSSKKSTIVRTDCHLLPPSTIVASLGGASVSLARDRSSGSKMAKTQSVPQSPTSNVVTKTAPTTSSDLLEREKKSQKLEKRDKLKKDKMAKNDEEEEERRKKSLKKQIETAEGAELAQSSNRKLVKPTLSSTLTTGAASSSVPPGSSNPSKPKSSTSAASQHQPPAGIPKQQFMSSNNQHDDMSKMLKEKISHLLNDNDRFLGIDTTKQQQQQQMKPAGSKENGASVTKPSRLQQFSQKSSQIASHPTPSFRNYKFVSQRRPTQLAGAGGDLETNKENMLFQARMNDDDLLEFNEENFNEIKHFEQNDMENANNNDEEGDEDEDENEVDLEYLDRHEHGKHRGIAYSASIKRHSQQTSGSSNINTLMHKKPRLVDPTGAMVPGSGGNLKSKRTKMEPTSSASFEFAGHGSSLSNAAASLSANAIKNEDLLSFGTGASGSNPIKKIERRHNLALLALKVNSDIDYIQSNAAKVGKLDENSSGGEDDAISPVNEKRLHPILFENIVSSKQRSDAIKPMQMSITSNLDSMAASYSPNDNNLLPGVGSLKSLKQKLDDQADDQSVQEARRIAAASSSKSKKETTTSIFKPSSLLGGIGVSSSANKPAINNQINMNKYYSMFKTVDTGDLVEQTGIPNVAMLLGDQPQTSSNTTNNNESYNFLNIYKKRGGSVPSSEYILNVINKRKQLNIENKNDEYTSDFISASNKLSQQIQQRLNSQSQQQQQQQQLRSANTGGTLGGGVNRAASVLSNANANENPAQQQKFSTAGYDSSFSSESISKYMLSGPSNNQVTKQPPNVPPIEPLELMLAKDKKSMKQQGHHARHHSHHSHRHHHHRHRSQSSKSAKLMSDEENTSVTESTSETQTSVTNGGATSSLTSASSTSSTSSSASTNSSTKSATSGSTVTVTPDQASVKLSRKPAKVPSLNSVEHQINANTILSSTSSQLAPPGIRSSLAGGAGVTLAQKPSPTNIQHTSKRLMGRHELIDKDQLRYSPNSLERLLNVNLNYLDNLTMSELKLEELDKVRCIGMAQQETVALAHLIKDQQQMQQQQQFLKKSAVINSKYYQDDEPPGADGMGQSKSSSSGHQQRAQRRNKHDGGDNEDYTGAGGGPSGTVHANQVPRSASLSSTLSSSASSINVNDEKDKTKHQQQQQQQRQRTANIKENVNAAGMTGASNLLPVRSISLSSTLSTSSNSSSIASALNNVNDEASKLLKLKQQQQQPQQASQTLFTSLAAKNKSKRLTLLNDDADLNEFISERDRRSTINGFAIEDDDELEKSFRQLLPSESHIKRTKQEQLKLEQSLLYNSMFAGTSMHAGGADLNPNSSLSQSFYENNLLMNPLQSTTTRFSFEDDSFRKFTSEIVKKYMQEEELRAKHQAYLLKLREKALLDKTHEELAWLEQLKKKVQDKGEDEKMPFLLKKEKGIRQKLREDVDNLKRLKETQRMDAEKRLRDLTQHSEVMKFYCKIKQHPGSGAGPSQQPVTSASFTALSNKTINENFDSAKNAVDQLISSKLHQNHPLKSGSGGSMPNIATASNATANNANEMSLDASVNPHHPDLSDNDEFDLMEHGAHDLTGGGQLQQQHQLDNSAALSNTSVGLGNQSLISEPKKYKHVSHLFSEKFLTEREKKLRLRRKAAEELIAWKKKLDDEELQVREIEKKAHQVLAKAPTTSTIASSGTAAAIAKSPTPAATVNKSKQPSSTIPATFNDGANEDYPTKSEQLKSYSESFVSTKGSLTTAKKTAGASIKSSQTSPRKKDSTRFDDEKSQTTTIRTSLDARTQDKLEEANEVIEEEIEYDEEDQDDEDATTKTISTATVIKQCSSGAKGKQASKSSSIALSKTPAAVGNSKLTKSSKQQSVSSSIDTNIEEDKSTSDKDDNRKYDDDESTSISASLMTPTTTTEKDLKEKVKALEETLVKKKTEAEQLRQSLKAKEKTKLKAKEEILLQKIETFDSAIDKMKSTLVSNKPAQQSAKSPSKKTDTSKAAAASSQKPSRLTTAFGNERRDTESSIAEELPLSQSIGGGDQSSSAEKSLPKLAQTLKGTVGFMAKSDDQIKFAKSEQLESIASDDQENEEEGVKSAASIITENNLNQTNVSSSSTTSQRSKLLKFTAKEAPEHRDEKYEEDDFDEATSATQRSETTAKSSSSSSSSSSSKTKSKSQSKAKQELVFSAVKSPREKPKDDEDADESKSTVSEISEEILGELSQSKDVSKRHTDAEDPFGLKLNKQSSVNDTTSSSSSTDTQILLLGSRSQNRVDSAKKQLDDVSIPSTPRQALDSFSKELNVPSKAESDKEKDGSMTTTPAAGKSHDDTDNEVEEEKIDHNVSVTREEDDNDTLVKSPRQDQADKGDGAKSKASLLVDNLEEKLLSQAISQMIDIKNQKMAKLNAIKSESNEEAKPADLSKTSASLLPPLKTNEPASSSAIISSSDLKILLPDDEENTFADDTAAIAAAAAAEAAEEAKLLSKLKKLNVPFNKKSLSRMVDTAIEDFFWKRLKSDQTLLLRTPKNRRFDSGGELDEDGEGGDEYDEAAESALYEQNQELAEFFRTDMQAEIDEEEAAKKEKESQEPNATADSNESNGEGSNARSIREKEVVFKRMVLDSIGELMHDLYLEKYERPQMANDFLPKMKLMPKKLYFKTIKMAPNSLLGLSDTKKLIKHKIFEILRLTNEIAGDKEFIDDNQYDDDEEPVSTAQNEIVRSYLAKQREKLLQQQRFKSKWRVQKRMDLVDKLLDYEMREQEYEWSNYELEEQEAKLAISDAILSMILKDTIDCFQLNLLKREEMIMNSQQQIPIIASPAWS